MAFGVNGIIGWVACWTPIGDQIEIAPTGVSVEHGACGTENAWVCRKKGRYAVVWVVGRNLRGKRSARLAATADPMIDRSAIAACVRWGTRDAAESELQAA